jgi:hypothetical protein
MIDELRTYRVQIMDVTEYLKAELSAALDIALSLDDCKTRCAAVADQMRRATARLDAIVERKHIDRADLH